MPATLPGDVEEDTGTGALAEQDQVDAAFRDITENYDKTAPEPKPSGGRGQVLGNRSSLKKKLLIGGGLGGGAVGLAIILFFLLLFKNIHIKNLFLDYEFAKFNRAFRNRLEQSVSEADPNGTADANTTVQPGDSPEQALGEIDSAQVRQLQNDLHNDPQALSDAVDNAVTLDQTASVSGTTASDIDPELKIDTTIASTDGLSDAKATETTDTAIKEGIDPGEGPRGAPNAAVQDAIDDTSTALADGAGPEAAAAKAGAGFSRGLNSILSQATGPFLFATIGCIARDIYVSSYKAVAQLKFSGLAKSAATVNKYADCQKQSKCSMNQIGAVANKFDGTVDGKTMSFTSSCASVRASGQVANPGVNCTDLDTSMRPAPNLADGFSGNVGTALRIADSVNSVLHIPGLGSGCDIILKPVTQVAFAVVNVGGAILGVVTDTVDFGASSVTQAAATSAGIIFASKAGKALALDAALHYGGLLFKQNFNPIQWGNMMGAGDKALAANSCARNGCRQLSQTENTQLALAIHADSIKEQRTRGLAYRLFSPENPMSTLGMLSTKVPSSPQTALASLGQFVATIFNPQRLGKSLFGFINPATPAWAADVAYNTYGMPDYGYTDAELGQWKVVDNSKWVLTNISPQQRAQFDKCFDPTRTKIADLAISNGQDATDCNTWADPQNHNIAFQHYRIYKLDTRVTHDLVLLYNNQGGVGGTNSAAPTSTDGCVNPLSDPAWGLSRTDQGVDYNPPNGHPLPVYAICDGYITSTNGPGWPGGVYINFKLTSGPFAGKCIYVAEHLTDVPQPDPNKIYKAGQQIATALPGSPWTEWGWSAGPADVSTHYPPGTSSDNHYPTEGGKAFARFIKSLGGPVRDDPGPGPLYPATGNSCS